MCATVCSDAKLNTHSCSREHVDERVDAEQVYLATNKIADPRLRYPKEACRRALSKLACLDETANFHHQLRAQPQAFRLLRSETEISEHIPGRTLNFHRPSHASVFSKRTFETIQKFVSLVETLSNYANRQGGRLAQKGRSV